MLKQWAGCGAIIARRFIHVTSFDRYTISGYFITGRNKVVAKVIFLHLFVILFTGGGVSASVHAGIPPPLEQTPPRADTPLGADPPEQTPPEAGTPPGLSTPPKD